MHFHKWSRVHLLVWLKPFEWCQGKKGHQTRAIDLTFYVMTRAPWRSEQKFSCSFCLLTKTRYFPKCLPSVWKASCLRNIDMSASHHEKDELGGTLQKYITSPYFKQNLCCSVASFSWQWEQKRKSKEKNNYLKVSHLEAVKLGVNCFCNHIYIQLLMHYCGWSLLISSIIGECSLFTPRHHFMYFPQHWDIHQISILKWYHEI